MIFEARGEGEDSWLHFGAMPELTDEVDYYKFEISKLPDGTPSHNLVTQDLEFASVGNLGIDTRQFFIMEPSVDFIENEGRIESVIDAFAATGISLNLVDDVWLETACSNLPEDPDDFPMVTLTFKD